MTDTKTCTYKSCTNTFVRQPNTSDGKWKQLSRCPDCRKKAHRTRYRLAGLRNPETMLGRYEVKSEIIDRFLYGQQTIIDESQFAHLILKHMGKELEESVLKHNAFFHSRTKK